MNLLCTGNPQRTIELGAYWSGASRIWQKSRNPYSHYMCSSMPTYWSTISL